MLHYCFKTAVRTRLKHHPLIRLSLAELVIGTALPAVSFQSVKATRMNPVESLPTQ